MSSLARPTTPRGSGMRLQCSACNTAKPASDFNLHQRVASVQHRTCEACLNIGVVAKADRDPDDPLYDGWAQRSSTPRCRDSPIRRVPSPPPRPGSARYAATPADIISSPRPPHRNLAQPQQEEVSRGRDQQHQRQQQQGAAHLPLPVRAESPCHFDSHHEIRAEAAAVTTTPKPKQAAAAAVAPPSQQRAVAPTAGATSATAAADPNLVATLTSKVEALQELLLRQQRNDALAKAGTERLLREATTETTRLTRENEELKKQVAQLKKAAATSGPGTASNKPAPAPPAPAMPMNSTSNSALVRKPSMVAPGAAPPLTALALLADVAQHRANDDRRSDKEVKVMNN